MTRREERGRRGRRLSEGWVQKEVVDERKGEEGEEVNGDEEE